MHQHRRRSAETIRWGLAVFLAVCVAAVGWRILRPVLWPHLHHETTRQMSDRMYNDNTFFR